MQRDKITSHEINKRFDVQSFTKQEETMSDYIVYNDEKQLLIPQIMNIHNDLVLNKKTCK
jgi:dephospho-CoA kinase